MRKSVALVIILAFLAACGSGNAAGPTTSIAAVPVTASPATDASTTVGPTSLLPTTTNPVPSTASTLAPTSLPNKDRPYKVFVPPQAAAGADLPLVVLLHGYTASGDIQEAYFQIQAQATERGFLYVHPDGTKSTIGERFWNATDACCDLGKSGVDDVAYLTSLISDVQRDYRVDPKRIFLIGHSNGGFMSYRMACERADTIAAIVSLAGATFADTKACHPSNPVSVAQIHGTLDKVIAYDGGSILGHPFPSAATSVGTWATYNGCAEPPVAGPTQLDLEAKLEGAESTVATAIGCPPGGAVELWTIAGGVHTPSLSSSFATLAIDFLLAHPKP